MVKKGLYVKVDEELLRKFDDKVRMLGLTRSDAIRRAMEDFVARLEGRTVTSCMRGVVRSRISLKVLEEAYLVFKS